MPALEDPTLEIRDAAFSEGGFAVREAPLFERGAHGHYREKQALQTEDPESVGRVMCVRTATWCYVDRLYEPPELYDLRTDPGELVNLAGRPALAEVERDLAGRVHRWLFDTVDVIPWTPDPRMEPALRAELRGEGIRRSNA